MIVPNLLGQFNSLLNKYDLTSSSFFSFFIMFHVGMAMEQGGAERWGLRLCLAWFYLTPSSPRPA